MLNFPEAFWPGTSKDYLRRIERISYLWDKFIVVGIHRGSSSVASRNVMDLYSIFNGQNKSKFIIYENDDKNLFTWSSCELISHHVDCDYIYEKLGHEKLKQDKSLLRRTRMAQYRNKVLERAREVLEDHKYFVVADLDVRGGYSHEGIVNSLSYMEENPNWIIGSNGIIYENGKRLYYDTWAYRDISWEYDEKRQEELNLMRFERGDTPKKVLSCFGGLCIYPASVLKTNAFYQSYDCDHVTLHKQLTNLGYEVYLNSSQIVLYSDNYYRTIYESYGPVDLGKDEILNSNTNT